MIDIQNGYFDRLLMTPIRRLAILLGQMTADLDRRGHCWRSRSSSVGFIVGVRFEAGPLGVLAFIVIAALWCLAFAGFAYAIALKTGQPGGGAVELPVVLPVPVPHVVVRAADQLSGWLDTVARFNPVTYILEGMRSLILEGWEWADIGKALLAIALVGAISMSLCFAALRGRIKKG